MKHNNWFWGVFFVLAAVFVIASQVSSFAWFSIWSIVATILLAAVFIQSLVKLNYFGVFLSLAFAYMVYEHPLHLNIISPWFLILTAVLLSIGFHIIFHRHPKHQHAYCREKKDEYHTVEEIDDNNPFVKVKMGASSKYLHADCLKSGQFYCSLGSLEVYFDHVRLDPNGAEIFVDCNLGAINLYFPTSWRIIDKLNSSLGGVNNETQYNNPGEDAPQVTITGNVSLGAIEIHYV